MSDRIGQLTARLQAHGVNFLGAGGGRTVDALEPLDVAAAFGWIRGAANQAIASYYYSVGNDRHGAVDALYLILAHESARQQLSQINAVLFGSPEEKLLSMARRNWPTMARKNGLEYNFAKRLRDIAGIVIDEKNARIKTDRCIAKDLGIGKSAGCDNWSQIVAFARNEVANALAAAEDDILRALKTSACEADKKAA